MKKWKVTLSWSEPQNDSVVVIAETEDDAIDMAAEDLGIDDIDCEVDYIEQLSHNEEIVEPIYNDPNQITMEFLQ